MCVCRVEKALCNNWLVGAGGSDFLIYFILINKSIENDSHLAINNEYRRKKEEKKQVYLYIRKIICGFEEWMNQRSVLFEQSFLSWSNTTYTHTQPKIYI